MSQTMEAKYLTTEQAAARCASKKRTFEYYRSIGVGPRYIKRRGLLRYRAEDVDKWMEEGECQTIERSSS